MDRFTYQVNNKETKKVLAYSLRTDVSRLSAIQRLGRFEDNVESMKKMQQNTIDDMYDTGFYNGIEYCLSLLESREANYREIPRKADC